MRTPVPVLGLTVSTVQVREAGSMLLWSMRTSCVFFISLSGVIPYI